MNSRKKDPSSSESLPSASGRLDFPTTSASVRKLGNGMTVILKEDHDSPVVSLQAWCETGSIHESRWLGAGVSHFLEHMVFKGTGRRTTGDIPRDVQAAGGSMNAYTSFDRTVYYINCPSDGTVACLDVLADLVTNAKIPEEEFDQEQEVIRREIAMGNDDPDSTLSELLFGTAFAIHPCRHPVIGHRRLFDRVSRDDLYRYYRERYIPENLFFVVTGDFDPEKIHEQLEASVGDFTPVSLDHPVLPAEPRQTGRRVVHQPFATALTSLAMAWRIPELSDPVSPALDVLASVLGEGRSSRLYREIREEKKLVHSIDAHSYAPGFTGLFVISAECEQEMRDDAMAAVTEMVEELKESGVTADEVGKAQSRILATQFSTLATMSGQAADLGSNWRETRNLDFTRDYLAAIQAVTPEEVRDAARTHLIESGSTIVSLNPESGESAAAAAPHIARKAAEPVIEKRMLSNGLSLLVRENPKTPLVSIGAIFRAGLLSESDATNGINQLCGRTLLKGTENRDADEIADALESRGGFIRHSAGNNSLAVNASVLRPDVSTGIEILADVLVNATIPEKALSQERETQLASVREQNRQPFPTSARILRQELFPGDPFGRNRYGTEASLEAIRREDILAYKSEHIAGANGVLTVYGDVRTDEIAALAEEHLGDLPAGQRLFDDRDPAPPLESSLRRETSLADKEQAVITIGFRTGSLLHEDREALDLIDEACSDMASRLFMRIREELGLAYYVGASQFPGLHAGAFYFYVGTDPERADEAERELLGEIKRMAGDGFESDELERVKAASRGRLLIDLQSNSSLAQTTGLDELFGLGFDHYKRSLENMEKLDAKTIRDICGKYFANRPMVVSRVLPEK